MSPLSGTTAPAIILTSVDFPAPFSPTSPCISPSSRVRLTLWTACTPGNYLSTSWISTAMGVWMSSAAMLPPVGDGRCSRFSIVVAS